MTDQPKEPGMSDATPAEMEKARRFVCDSPYAGIDGEVLKLAALLHSHAEEAVKAATEELRRDVEQLVQRCEREAREKAEGLLQATLTQLRERDQQLSDTVRLVVRERHPFVAFAPAMVCACGKPERDHEMERDSG